MSYLASASLAERLSLIQEAFAPQLAQQGRIFPEQMETERAAAPIWDRVERRHCVNSQNPAHNRRSTDRGGLLRRDTYCSPAVALSAERLCRMGSVAAMADN